MSGEGEGVKERRGDESSTPSAPAKASGSKASVKANGSAAKIPWGEPGGHSQPGGSIQGTSVGKSPPSVPSPPDGGALKGSPSSSSQPAGPAKQDQRCRQPEDVAKGAKQATESEAQDRGERSKDGGKTETIVGGGDRKAEGAERKESGTAASHKAPDPSKKSSSDKSVPSKSESIAGTSVRKIKESSEVKDYFGGISRKAQDPSKRKSLTDENSVSAKTESLLAARDSGVKDRENKEIVGVVSKKAQDTSKRKSPTGDKKVPAKSETSFDTLDRKKEDSGGKGVVGISAQKGQNVTRKKSPTDEKSVGLAIAGDTDRKVEVPEDRVLVGGTFPKDEESTKKNPPNGEKSLSSKSVSVTGSKGSEVVSSVPKIAQETLKRKSQTDEKSIPSAKSDTTTGNSGRMIKETEKKEIVTLPISKAQSHANKKPPDSETSTSINSMTFTSDTSPKTTELGSKEPVSATPQKVQDLSTKKKAADGEKVALSKPNATSGCIDQKDAGTQQLVSPPLKSDQGPSKKSPNGRKPTSSKDPKSPTGIDERTEKPSSPESGTEGKVVTKSPPQKASLNTVTVDTSVEKSKIKADITDASLKKSLSYTQSSKPEDTPLKGAKVKTPPTEKSVVPTAEALKQKYDTKSDMAVMKEKDVKVTTPGTSEATKVQGAGGIPKDEKVKNQESENAAVGSLSSGVSAGGTLQQRDDTSKVKPTDSKKTIVNGELPETKDSKMHKPKSSDAKMANVSNGNGVVVTEQRSKSQNGGDRQDQKVKIQVNLAKERSNNGKKPMASPVDSKRSKNGELSGKEEGRPCTQKGNGQAVTSPSSSVRMDGFISGASVTQNGASSRTPTEHKTIVQKLQEARQEAILVRGSERRDIRQQYSKSEMVLPAAVQTIPVVSGDPGDKQVTSSPNIKVQTPTTHAPTVAAASAARIGGRGGQPSPKEISKSEAVLPAAERAKEKQRTSSPNLSAHANGRQATGSAEGLTRHSHGGKARNGHSEAPGRDPSSRKGSVISDTTAEAPPGGASRARSATWSQAAPQPARRDDAEEDESSTAPVSAASEDPEWDKRWSSAGSDVLAHKGYKGGAPRGPGARAGAIGKEWRSEWGSESAWRGVVPGGRVWESEAGLLGRPQRGAPPGRLDLGAPGPLVRKELVSPSSSSTASKGSGIERISEASSSYHSATSSTHGQRRDSVKGGEQQQKGPGEEEEGDGGRDAPPEDEDEVAAPEAGCGDRVKLIEGAGGGGAPREMERKAGGGSGKRRGHHAPPSGGVENRGADLERVLLEEEEAAAAATREEPVAGPAEQRIFIDIWDSEDKFSVANSQLPLTPAGEEEDAGSIGSVMTAEPERGNWTGRFDFLLSLLGYSVGLGNVWRFPYLCYNNGGGAFLIPFTIMLVIAGLPLMFMELSFGQYANLGPAAIYSKFCPLFHGLGYGMVIVSTVVMLYYNLIIAWTIFYMFASFNKQLPWQNCEPEWSTLDCYSYEIADKCAEANGTYYQRTCYNESEAAASNISHLAEIAEKRPPAEEYFNNYVLGLSNGIEETGEVRLSMALCLLLAWVIVFLCLSKGVQSSGKVVYFTALFPYVVLIILFIRGVTLPGASTGILFYLTPDWRRLSNAQVWGDAAVQIFFALSPAWGGLITLASYNKFSNNCYKDSLIVAVSNILTSFFAGFVIFSVIGFLAHELNVEVKKVVDQGAGLAFIVYPEVVTRLPVSPVWSLLFFVMLLTLGLDSQFALMETVTTAILDRFPNLREKKVWVVLVVAVLGYFGGLIFTTNSGMYWLQLMDKYAANWSVLLIAISECILIAWVYGARRFLRDVQEMIGPQSRLWMFFWCWMWKLVTPATLLFILFFNWVEYAPASYGEYIYPMWADAAGWVIGVLPVMVIIVVGVVKVCTAPEGALRDKLRKLLQPTPDWGPSLKRSSAPPTYDSIRNTIVLMNGLPVIQETHVESQEDNTL